MKGKPGRVGKKRIDALLVERGLFETRQKARAAVMAGEVLVGDEVAGKAGALVAADCEVRVRCRARYVGRGGDKLARALEVFGIDPAGKRAIDVGASTGGFTHCLLEAGAASVHAVDVGYGQLALPLRNDPRVSVAERTNIRNVTPGDVPHAFDLAVIDVSFISLELVLPVVRELLAPGGRTIALVKPQFEVGKGKVGKGGVVRERGLHEEVLEKVVSFCGGAGLAALGAAASPLRGPKGNIEFFLLIAKSGEAGRGSVSREDIVGIVAAAHDSPG
ncbi:MAG: TlyA family RNA methyltransferase [bacterium]